MTSCCTGNPSARGTRSYRGRRRRPCTVPLHRFPAPFPCTPPYTVPLHPSLPQSLILEPGEYAVVQLDASAPLPAWLPLAPFWTITRAADELSMVCAAEAVPFDVSHENGWRLLRLQGPFPFDLSGILESVLAPLAAGGVGIFAISTFNTDYVLVKHASLKVAIGALRAAGHTVVDV
jgi:hypothetical protein